MTVSVQILIDNITGERLLVTHAGLNTWNSQRFRNVRGGELTRAGLLDHSNRSEMSQEAS